MSPRPIQDPVTKPDGDWGTLTTHPAFGQISAHRISGHSVLYGSDFRHNASVRIRIARSKNRRNLSHDWHHAEQELIEVEVSEAQWATFISSMNTGDGTPCTILQVQGEQMPGLPDPIDRSKQFAGELDGKLRGCVGELRGMIAAMDSMGLPKGKTAALRELLEKIDRELTANLPFVADSFGKHVEKTVEKAKQEIHGYMQGVVNRAGIAALKGEPLPLQIEARNDDDKTR